MHGTGIMEYFEGIIPLYLGPEKEKHMWHDDNYNDDEDLEDMIGSSLVLNIDYSFYNGEWKNGKRDGEGTFVKQIEVEGKKVISLTYKGSWKGFDENDIFGREPGMGKPHGFGKLVYNKLTDPTLYPGYQYIGNFKNGMFHGKGTKTWDLFSEAIKFFKKYEGMWKERKMHGKGTMTYVDDSKYEGDWVDGKREGKGIRTYGDMFGEAYGNLFQGTWENDTELRGELKISSGKYEGVYFGEVKSGIPHGEDGGTLTFDNGDKYSGGWNHGKPNGTGRYFDIITKKWSQGEWANGILKQTWSRFSGMFSEETHKNFLDILKNVIGPYLPPKKYAQLHLLSESLHKKFEFENIKSIQYHDSRNKKVFYVGGTVKRFDIGDEIYPLGKGVMMYNDGQSYYGNFRFGKIHGYGVLQKSPSNNSSNYFGQWNNGKMLGNGGIIFPKKKVLNAIFNLDGIKMTNVSINYLNGMKYLGEIYRNHEPFGKGVLTSSGGIYEGNFIYGDMDGQGTFTYIDGDKYVGEWKEGKRNGFGTFTFENGNTYIGNWEEHLPAFNGVFTIKKSGVTITDIERIIELWFSR